MNSKLALVAFGTLVLLANEANAGGRSGQTHFRSFGQSYGYSAREKSPGRIFENSHGYVVPGAGPWTYIRT
jgi:hypothetical protein